MSGEDPKQLSVAELLARNGAQAATQSSGGGRRRRGGRGISVAELTGDLPVIREGGSHSAHAAPESEAPEAPPNEPAPDTPPAAETPNYVPRPWESPDYEAPRFDAAQFGSPAPEPTAYSAPAPDEPAYSPMSGPITRYDPLSAPYAAPEPTPRPDPLGHSGRVMPGREMPGPSSRHSAPDAPAADPYGAAPAPYAPEPAAYTPEPPAYAPEPAPPVAEPLPRRSGRRRKHEPDESATQVYEIPDVGAEPVRPERAPRNGVAGELGRSRPSRAARRRAAEQEDEGPSTAPWSSPSSGGFESNGFESGGFQGDGFQGAGFQGNDFQGNGFEPNGYEPNGFGGNGFGPNGFQANGFDANAAPAAPPAPQPMPAPEPPSRRSPRREGFGPDNRDEREGRNGRANGALPAWSARRHKPAPPPPVDDAPESGGLPTSAWSLASQDQQLLSGSTVAGDLLRDGVERAERGQRARQGRGAEREPVDLLEADDGYTDVYGPYTGDMDVLDDDDLDEPEPTRTGKPGRAAARRSRGGRRDEHDVNRRQWLILGGQSAGAAIAGMLLFKGFESMWEMLPWVALALAMIVILGLVALVRILRRTDDILSTVIAVVVGIFVTLGPLAFLLSTN